MAESEVTEACVTRQGICAEHLRSIVGSMTVEGIGTELQKLAEGVLDGSRLEMTKIGLTSTCIGYRAYQLRPR